jgi:hypothetical protein
MRRLAEWADAFLERYASLLIIVVALLVLVGEIGRASLPCVVVGGAP